jgi:phosphohistidine swiveling domain-containing protein
MDIGKLYTTQISMTEWFERIGHDKTMALRDEDNKKRERLKVINRLTGMPFDEPVQFTAQDISKNTPAFQKYLKEHSEETVALRLIPADPALPKHRLRGKTVREMVEWFHTLNIDPAAYSADFVPHAAVQLFSTIFVVNKNGIFGEIIKGGHYQLTQGFYEDHKPVTFSYDWKTWNLSDDQPEYREDLAAIAKWLQINDAEQRAKLTKELSATFTDDNYLEGYFETITNGEGIGLWFIDYNRILGDMLSDAQAASQTSDDVPVKGQPASRGTATGTVRIIHEADVATATITEGDILVCDITTPDYIQLIQKAAAVVTDRGGILSHAAIVCRELGKPCIAGTGNATKVLHDGQKITVNATEGYIKD